MRPYLPFALILLTALPAAAQQTLFTEDFEGTQTAFTLNTTDVGSTASGANTWLENNAYTGGSGTIECSGLSVPFNVANTAAQPVGISTPNGHYMHITSTEAMANDILNCCFAAADGFCTPAGNHFARMSSDVSTVGSSEATFSFWWLCAGSNNCYGQVYYSTDGGTTWTQITEPLLKYRAQSTWTSQSITMAEFGEQATLRFGFRFVNGTTLNANDPAFGIDDVSITSALGASTIAIGPLLISSYCQGSSFNLPYVASGTWIMGNVFTAELSDASGSFASPVDIGSLTSTASGSIAATIPSNTPEGSGYLIRVTSSTPVVTGTPTPTGLTISAPPYAGEDAAVSLCADGSTQSLIDLLPGASDCGSWSDPLGNPTSGVLDAATALSGGYTYATNCLGACPQDEAVVTVTIVTPPDAGGDATITICTNAPPIALFGFLSGTPEAGGTWTGPSGVFSGILNPQTGLSGNYVYYLAGVAPCAADSATLTVLLDPCSGITEENATSDMVHWLGQAGEVQLIGLGDLRPDRIELFDASGRLLSPGTTKVDGQRLSIDMSGMEPGVYLVRLRADDHQAVLRLVKAE